jgi:hypothetical protein
MSHLPGKPSFSALLLSTFLLLEACAGQRTDGWTKSGNVYSAAFSVTPSSALKLTLDLGSVSSIENATIEAQVQNSGASEIPYGGIVLESGHVALCPCDGGALSLGSLDRSECLRMRVRPVKTTSGTENVTFRVTGLVEINISAILPAALPTTTGGLVISNTCSN